MKIVYFLFIFFLIFAATEQKAKSQKKNKIK